MHTITIDKDHDFGPNGNIRAGKYLMEDIGAADLMTMLGEGNTSVARHDLPDLTITDVPIDYSGTITVLRPARFGDLILLTPCLREIKRRFPKCRLVVACIHHYAQPLIGLPYVDGFEEYPLAMDKDHGLLLSLVNDPKHNARQRDLHMTDLFAERLGINSMETKKPDFFLSNEEREWAFEKYPRAHPIRVGIQVKASTPSRTYPNSEQYKVIHALNMKKWDIVLLGAPGEISLKGKCPTNMHNTSEDGLTFRQSAAILSTCNVFLGPDSSLTHVAGAMEIPSVALFGPIPWKLRTAYYPKTFAIQGILACAPCHFSPTSRNNNWPAGGPCAKTNQCEALAGISADRIVAKLESMANA